jgi:protease IV
MTTGKKVFLVIATLLLVFVLVIGIIGLLIYMAINKREPSVASNTYLRLTLEGNLPDYTTQDPVMSRLFGQEQNSLTDFITQLRKAKIDKRVNGIFLEIKGTDAGWAKIEELRDAIKDFRSSGKPIYSFMELGSDREYYLATATEKIFVAPIGHLYIDGLAAETMFVRGTLDKLGVYMDTYQIGKYKNAPDMFTRKEMSEAHREVVNAMLDDIFNRLIHEISTARKKSPEDVRMLIDSAPVSAVQAQQAGLIDGTKYRVEVEEELKKRIGKRGGDDPQVMLASRYRKVTPESLGLNKGDQIALVFAAGPIDLGDSQEGPQGESIGSDTVARAIRDAAEDKKTKAVVLRVDSPGGSVYASNIIWNAVENARKKKPVVVSMSDVAASGGYYIAANANKILAQPSTITGSIGVYAMKPVVKGFYDWIGVSSEYVLRGKNAGIFRETEPFTPEERAKFESIINSFYYEDFIPKVAKGRNRPVEYVD